MKLHHDNASKDKNLRYIQYNRINCRTSNAFELNPWSIFMLFLSYQTLTTTLYIQLWFGLSFAGT